MACAKCRTARGLATINCTCSCALNSSARSSAYSPVASKTTLTRCPPAGESAQQLPMSRRRVGKTRQLHTSFSFSCHHQLSGTHFHSTAFDIVHHHSLE